MNCINCGLDMLDSDDPCPQSADGQHVPNPLTELAGGAAALHELYESYVEAGFSDRQSLYIVAMIATSGNLRPPDGTD